jgi:drug/metabolite transporter (DMT)-like permease
MGIVAPLSAVLTAMVPLFFSFLMEGFPGMTRVAGFGSALVAVWLFSATGTRGVRLNREIVFSLSAGVGFGLFFICIDQVSDEAILWPLVAARAASVGTMAVLMGVMGKGGRRPGRGLWTFIVLAGLLDTAGNALFALASQVGRLDVSAVLASMYPAATVMLARAVLKEKIGRQQQVGLVVACVALGLIAV